MKKIAFLSFVAALGGILFGYDTAVISGTIAVGEPVAWESPRTANCHVGLVFPDGV